MAPEAWAVGTPPGIGVNSLDRTAKASSSEGVSSCSECDNFRWEPWEGAYKGMGTCRLYDTLTQVTELCDSFRRAPSGSTEKRSGRESFQDKAQREMQKRDEDRISDGWG